MPTPKSVYECDCFLTFEPGVRVPGTPYTTAKVGLYQGAVVAILRGPTFIEIPTATVSATRTGARTWEVKVLIGDRQAVVDRWPCAPKGVSEVPPDPAALAAWEEEVEAEKARRESYHAMCIASAQAAPEKRDRELRRRADAIRWGPLAPLVPAVLGGGIVEPLYDELSKKLPLPWRRRLARQGRMDLLVEMVSILRGGRPAQVHAGSRSPQARAARIVAEVMGDDAPLKGEILPLD